MNSGANVGPGTVLGGDFRIERPLGRGGMGTVYLATQLSTHRQRALKVLHSALVTDPVTVSRFVEEARIGARIRSEHVVDVVAAGVDRDTRVPWLAMELLEGEDLASFVTQAGGIAPAALRPLMAQLRHALEPAHAQGIVHRDLKPENLYLCRPRRHGADTMLKVLDFGIAKSLAEGRAAGTATAPIGSPLFMAPEQAQQGATIRASTDVWALGLIGFYTLTGKHYWCSAHGKPNLQAILAEILIEPIAPPSARARQLGVTRALPPELDDWFAGCVSRDPTQRFHDAGACLLALDAVLAGKQRTPVAFAPTVESAATPAARPGVAPPGAVARPAVVVSPAPLRQRSVGVAPTAPMTSGSRQASGTPRSHTPAPASAPERHPRTAAASRPVVAVGSAASTTAPAALPSPSMTGSETAPSFEDPADHESDDLSVVPARINRGTVMIAILLGGMSLGGLYAAYQLYGEYDTRTGGYASSRETFASLDADPSGESAIVRFTGPEDSTFQVRLDDRVLGRPPLDVRLRPGIHFVDLLDDDDSVVYDWFATYGADRFTVRLRPLDLPTIPLPAGSAGLAVQADSDTSVHLDGQPIDASQARSLPVGPHEIRFSSPSSASEERLSVVAVEGSWIVIKRRRAGLARRR